MRAFFIYYLKQNHYFNIKLSMVTKILVFILIFSILNLIRESFLFYRSLRIGEKDITNKRLWGIGISLAYILTIIFTGIGF